MTLDMAWQIGNTENASTMTPWITVHERQQGSVLQYYSQRLTIGSTSNMDRSKASASSCDVTSSTLPNPSASVGGTSFFTKPSTIRPQAAGLVSDIVGWPFREQMLAMQSSAVLLKNIAATSFGSGAYIRSKRRLRSAGATQHLSTTKGRQDKALDFEAIPSDVSNWPLRDLSSSDEHTPHPARARLAAKDDFPDPGKPTSMTMRGAPGRGA